MSESKDAGRFKSMVRRFTTKGSLMSKPTVHAMTYNREDRVWSVRCTPSVFPAAGMMLSVAADQPPITCKDCLGTLGDAV